MAATRKANLGLYEGWADNEDGWGAGMNDNLRRLDLFVCPRVAQVGLNAPPGSPADGDAYVIGTSGSGAWSGHNNEIARWDDVAGVWEFVTPKSGWSFYAVDVGRHYQYSGSVWVGAQPFDAYCFSANTPTANAILVRVPLVRAIVFPADFAGSYGSAAVAATGSTVFTIRKNGTSVGTATFGAAGTTATFVSSGGSAVSFAAGDILSITAPASPDATLADVGFGISGIR